MPKPTSVEAVTDSGAAFERHVVPARHQHGRDAARAVERWNAAIDARSP